MKLLKVLIQRYENWCANMWVRLMNDNFKCWESTKDMKYLKRMFRCMECAIIVMPKDTPEWKEFVEWSKDFREELESAE